MKHLSRLEFDEIVIVNCWNTAAGGLFRSVSMLFHMTSKRVITYECCIANATAEIGRKHHLLLRHHWFYPNNICKGNIWGNNIWGHWGHFHSFFSTWRWHNIWYYDCFTRVIFSAMFDQSHFWGSGELTSITFVHHFRAFHMQLGMPFQIRISLTCKSARWMGANKWPRVIGNNMRFSVSSFHMCFQPLFRGCHKVTLCTGNGCLFRFVSFQMGLQHVFVVG